MKLILINGSSCSGKSTAVKAILKRKEKLYHLSYDSLKRSFAQYVPEKHIRDIRTLILSVARTMFGLGYDIICDSISTKEPREKLIALAREFGYEIIEINFEADHDVLLRRFDERVLHAKAHPDIPITNLSRERWEELYTLYQNDKNRSALIIRTDEQDPEETLQAVLKRIS
jgi:predicted kinase